MNCLGRAVRRTALSRFFPLFFAAVVLLLGACGFATDTVAVGEDEPDLLAVIESEYLVGDWNGDGLDNLAVRRGNCVYMDFNFDGVHDRLQCYGNG
ncbi:hypothetical protein, partial [Cystobacter fuscus]|uniref:hypothetical protein n=1 Tax=Cystobacter fuscus TaxID=43 RepID=UPI0012DF44A2